jgi:hypothetical protein
MSQPSVTGSVDERIIVEDRHGREIPLSNERVIDACVRHHTLVVIATTGL